MAPADGGGRRLQGSRPRLPSARRRAPPCASTSGSHRATAAKLEPRSRYGEGRTQPWDADSIAAAMASSVDEHGKPPTGRDWRSAAPGRPTYQRVYEVVGWRRGARAGTGSRRSLELSSDSDHRRPVTYTQRSYG